MTALQHFVKFSFESAMNLQLQNIHIAYVQLINFFSTQSHWQFGVVRSSLPRTVDNFITLRRFKTMWVSVYVCNWTFVEVSVQSCSNILVHLIRFWKLFPNRWNEAFYEIKSFATIIRVWHSIFTQNLLCVFPFHMSILHRRMFAPIGAIAWTFIDSKRTKFLG